jgi:aryl-alcohol dehydrogenase-like predicted oxidoreductase
MTLKSVSMPIHFSTLQTSYIILLSKGKDNSMKYLHINSYNTELEISKIAIGSSSRISKIPEDELFRIFDSYVDAGGNCFDSARGYFGGKSEALIGKWQHSRNIRNKILLCTKAGNSLNPRDPETKPRLSYNELKSDLEQTFKAMNSDVIDIFWLHRDDTTVPVEEIIESINRFINDGIVRMVGCSNWTPDRIESANKYARDNNLHGFLASQIRWNIGEQRPGTDPENLPSMDAKSYKWYLENQLPVFAFSAQAQGFFAKAAANGIDSLSEASRNVYETPNNLIRLERLKQYAKESNISVTAAVLGYIIYNRLPSVAVITSSNTEQLKDSLSALDFTMTADEADMLFQI